MRKRMMVMMIMKMVVMRKRIFVEGSPHHHEVSGEISLDRTVTSSCDAVTVVERKSSGDSAACEDECGV